MTTNENMKIRTLPSMGDCGHSLKRLMNPSIILTGNLNAKHTDQDLLHPQRR